MVEKGEKRILNTENKVTVHWIPSHCDIPGNDKADALAEEGTELNQDNTPVTHQIVKSRIKARKWSISHQRATDTYENRHMNASKMLRQLNTYSATAQPKLRAAIN